MQGLRPGDGDGTSGGMESRVTRLEVLAEETGKRLERIDNKLDRLAEDVAEIKGRVSALPTTWQMIGLVVAVLAGSYAVVRFGLPLVQ